MRSFLSATGQALALCLASQLSWGGDEVRAEQPRAVVVSVQEVAAKLGENAVVMVRVAPAQGYRIADAYRNRITTLSGGDDGVHIDATVVRGAVQDGSLIFKIPVTAIKSGTHTINGVIRYALVSSSDQERRLDIKWEPLIATVTATP